MATEIQECPHCGTPGIPTSVGRCPVCRAELAAASSSLTGATAAGANSPPQGFTQLSASQWAQQVLALLHQVETPFLSRRQMALRTWQEGSATSLELASDIERELLPRYAAALQQVLAATVADNTATAVVEDLRKYVAMRVHSWQTLAEMIRNSDEAKLEEHRQVWEQAELLVANLYADQASTTHGRTAADVRDFQLALAAATPKLRVAPLIIGINVVVFVLMIISGVHLLAPTVLDALKWGANFGPRTLNGQEWRLVSSMFVHFGIIHLAFNMWVLWDLAQLVERLVGNLGFLLLYFISGIAGSLASLAWNPVVVSAGASGAVFGVAGALLGLIVTRRDTIPGPVLLPLRNSMLVFLAINVFFGLSVEGIDMAAHIGGLAAGFVSGMILSQPLSAESVSRRSIRNAVLLAIGATGLVVTGLLLPDPPIDLQAELQEFAATEQRVIDRYNALIQDAQTGTIDANEFANAIEREILPDWVAVTKRFESLVNDKQAKRARLPQLLDYVNTRAESWQLRVDGIRTQDFAKLEQANQRWNAAEALARQFAGEQR